LLQKAFDALIAIGPLGILLISAIDSAGIPLPGGPDAAVLLLAIEAPALGYWGALTAVVGSIAGNTFLFLAARRGGRAFLERAQEPGSRSLRFRQWFGRYGLVTVFVPPLVPIPMPLKIFVISAGALGVRLRNFLAVILLARIPRFFGEAYLGVRLGRDSNRFLEEHGWTLAGISLGLLALCWAAAALLGRPRRREEA